MRVTVKFGDKTTWRAFTESPREKRQRARDLFEAARLATGVDEPSAEDDAADRGGGH